MKAPHRFCVVVLAALVFEPAAVAQQFIARRSVYAGRWTDPNNGVTGLYATAQEVCDERARLINWPAMYLPMRPVFWFDGGSYAAARYCVDANGWIMGYAYQLWECPPNYNMGGTSGRLHCESSQPVIDLWHDKPQNSCQLSGGNPIFPLTGTKRQNEVLVRWSPNEPPLAVVYDNRRKPPNGDPEGAFTATAAPSFGRRLVRTRARPHSVC